MFLMHKQNTLQTLAVYTHTVACRRLLVAGANSLITCPHDRCLFCPPLSMPLPEVLPSLCVQQMSRNRDLLKQMGKVGKRRKKGRKEERKQHWAAGMPSSTVQQPSKFSRAPRAGWGLCHRPKHPLHFNCHCTTVQPPRTSPDAISVPWEISPFATQAQAVTPVFLPPHPILHACTNAQ